MSFAIERDQSKLYSELSRITDPSAAVRGFWSTRAIALARIYEWVESIYGPATDKGQHRPGRGRIEKQSREFRDVGSARFLFFLARVRQEIRRRCREHVSEWVVSESPVGVVTRPAISVIGGSPIMFRSFLLHARRSAEDSPRVL